MTSCRLRGLGPDDWLPEWYECSAVLILRCVIGVLTGVSAVEWYGRQHTGRIAWDDVLVVVVPVVLRGMTNGRA